MLIQDFHGRAAEYIRLAEYARSERDRKFFIAMARAWHGVRAEATNGLGAPERRRVSANGGK